VETSGIPTVVSTRLVLRAFRPEDGPAYHRILSTDGVLRYFPTASPPAPERVPAIIGRILQHWKEHGFGIWAVASPSGDLMGRAGIQTIPETGEVEVDYLLGREWWGSGFATEAIRPALRFGLEEKGLERIVGIVHPDNLASRRVLEKIGMHLEGEKEYFGMRCLRYAVSRWERNVDDE
jgi:ribosomal-protein-alanine N-acetyltransferase